MGLGSLYLSLDQKRIFNGDFSSDSKLTGTIYSDAAMITPFTLTGYTIILRMYRGDSNSDFFNKTAGIVSAAAGTISYAITENELPPGNIYLVKAELSKSGTRLSTINTVELYILPGPTA